MVCVHLGAGKKNGQWCDEEALVAHVIWKRHGRELPKEEHLPKRRLGLRVDVIETGRYQLTTAGLCDHTDAVQALASPQDRRSTVSALCWDDRFGGLALVSGHGTLPVRNHRYQPAQASQDVRAALHDAERPTAFVAQLQQGASGGSADTAVCALAWTPKALIDPVHLVGGTPPFPVRRSLSPGLQVHHYSAVRGRFIGGLFRHESLTPAPFYAEDGSGTSFRLGAVFAIESQVESFAWPGDSGSLVFDLQGNAIGTIVGRDAYGRTAFVLPVGDTRSLLGEYYASFFGD